jgi:hypothetical protein
MNTPNQKQVDEALSKISMLASRNGIEYVVIEDEAIDLYCEDNDITLTPDQRAKAKGMMADFLKEMLESDDCLNLISEAAE